MSETSEVEEAGKTAIEGVTQGIEQIGHGVHQIEDGQGWQDTVAGVGDVEHGVGDLLIPGASQWDAAGEHLGQAIVDAWSGHDGTGGDGAAFSQDAQDGYSAAGAGEAAVEDAGEGDDN